MPGIHDTWERGRRVARFPVTLLRAAAGAAELIVAARPLAYPDGPLRGPDGIAVRLQSLLAEGGALARLDDLADAGAILAPLAEPGGPLTRLGDLVDTLERLASLEASLTRLAMLTESVEELAGTTQSLPGLADSAASLPELTELVRSVQAQVATIHDQLEVMSPSLETLGRVAGRLPGSRRSLPAA
jgi:hypothetical protein